MDSIMQQGLRRKAKCAQKLINVEKKSKFVKTKQKKQQQNNKLLSSCVHEYSSATHPCIVRNL